MMILSLKSNSVFDPFEFDHIVLGIFDKVADQYCKQNVIFKEVCLPVPPYCGDDGAKMPKTVRI